MSEVLLRFAHISDTHIEPEAGARQRRLASIERIKGITSLPDFVLKAVLEHEQSHVDGTMPFASAVAASTALVAELNTLQLDFVLHTGDIVNHGEAEEYAEAERIFAQLRHPIYYAAGNHDKIEPLYAGLLKQPASKEALDYTVEVNGVQIVCIDSATYGEGIQWRVTPAQLEWLERQIAADDPRPLVVAIHHPPVKINVDWLDFFIVTNWEEIQGVLESAGERLRAVFSGHVHLPIDCYRNGVLYSIVPEVFSHTPGYSVVTVTDEDVLIERRTLAKL